jgi:hypothetical protein
MWPLGGGDAVQPADGPSFFMYEGPSYDPSPEALRYVVEALHDPFDANGQVEFFGEALLYWELRRHPLRTRDATRASLFVLPSLPQLDPAGTQRAAARLAQEPTWQRRRGADHIVLCTHWQCAGYLGALFQMVAVPGLLAALERNIMWLDPRTPHWFNNRTEQAPFDFALPRPLCLDRTIVVPYPPHASLLHHCGEQPEYVPWTERRINVSFYGTIRQRRGMPDSSDGVRSSLGKLAHGPDGHRGMTDRGLDVRLFRSNEDDPNRRCGPGLARECQPLVGTGGKLKGPSYAQAMRDSRFCLHLRGDTSTSRRLSDAVAAGCIPVIVSDFIGPNMPFVFAAGEPPLHPPRVRYEDWSIRILEADFIANPLAAVDAVLSRFLMPSAGGGAPLIGEMQAAMRRDSGDILFCRDRSDRKDAPAEHRLADQVLGEAFARLRDACGNCSGKAPTIVYRARRIRNVRHAFRYRDCLGAHEVAGKWAWEPSEHGAVQLAERGHRARLSAFPVDRTFIVT